MTRQLAALTLCAAVSLLGVPRVGSASGRDSKQADQYTNWDNLARLKTAARVVVTTDHEREIEGALKAANPDVLQLVDADGLERTIRRAEIREVRLGPKHGAGLYAGVGLLLGAALGAVVGSANRGDSELYAAPIVGVMFGTLVGGSVGYAVGSGINSRPWRVVYKRPTAAAATVTFFPLVKGPEKGLGFTIAF